MKSLVLGSLIAIVAAQAAGCIISTDGGGGGGGGGGGVAHVNVTWNLVSAVSGGASACPQGYDTAALYSQEVDSSGNAIGDPIVDLFDCAAGNGTSAALPPALYNEWIEIADHNNTSQYASSPSSLEQGQIIDLIDADLAYSTDIVVDGGQFSLTWDLVGASSNAPLTCADAGATGGVEAVSTDVANSSTFFDDIFDCANPTLPLTSPLPTATYTISVDALNGQMQAIGTAPALTNEVIQDPSALHPVTDLGTITIPIDGQ